MKEFGTRPSGALARGMLSNIHNVKKGDMLYTDIGSVVLIRETRARWFYLMKGRVSSVKKTTLWELVDTGRMKVSYAKEKKYRTKQRKFRTLDIRFAPERNQEEMFEKFIDFVKTPFNILYSLDNSSNISYYKHRLSEMGFEYTSENEGSDQIILRISE